MTLTACGGWADGGVEALASLGAAVTDDRVSFRFARTPLRRV